MKRTLLLLTMGALLACPSLTKADDSTTPPSAPPPGEGHHHHDMMAGLSDADKAELKKAHDEAVAADPSLATEEEALKTDADKEKMHAFREKLDAAMIKADPAVAPIIEKMKAHHHKDGPPPAGA